MICPMKLANPNRRPIDVIDYSTTVEDVEERSVKCDEGKCAWWVRLDLGPHNQYEGCAIHGIAEALYRRS